ncbi:neprilysin-4 [Musca domestica]|uniref:Neprilysin-4 n=1 Tax=Musca domestica TaxID=7370 RepID=A0A9J7CQD9_MUSDO|nr:neprilysin-4 [Musca domestica]
MSSTLRQILEYITISLVFLEIHAVPTTLPPLKEHPLHCNASHWPGVKRQMEDYMDLLEKPCEDFWDYACGNWRVPHQLRFMKPTDTLTAIKAQNKNLLMQYFDETEKRQADPHHDTVEQSVVKFYKSCLDKRILRSRTQDELAIRLYTDVLGNFSSSWPVLHSNFSSSRVANNFNWEYVAGQMRRYGSQTLIRTLVQPNWQSSQQLIVYLMPPSFELLKARQSDSSYDEESVFFYERYIKMLMMDLGVRVRKSNLIAREVVQFEQSLLALVNNKDVMILKEPQSLASLARELPQVDLMKYFKTLLQDFQLPPNFASKMLIVADKNYLRSLVPLLDKTKIETIAKYFMVQFLVNFEVNLHDDEGYFKQKEECLRQVNDFMPSELSRIFLRLQHGYDEEEFLTETQRHLEEIFSKLKVQFEKMINSTVVFERDVYSKNLSIEKIRNMRLLLPKLEGNSSIGSKSLEITENYDLNLIALKKFKNQQQLQQLIPHMVSDVMEIKMDPELSLSSLYFDQSYGPLDVNAYYRLKKNAIELPIGILTAPLYDRCLKPAKIYGGFVYILAHELLHGFDYDGMNYGKYGNTNNGWGPKAIIKFGVQSNCYLADRYADGHSTINENIADSEGLRLALETLLDYEMDQSFDQNDLKLFFLSFAQTWCGTGGGGSGATGGEGSFRIHASHQERVNNVLGNFMEFADVYKCEEMTPLNPESKCRIW